jgi:hypothetical protein
MRRATSSCSHGDASQGNWCAQRVAATGSMEGGRWVLMRSKLQAVSGTASILAWCFTTSFKGYPGACPASAQFATLGPRNPFAKPA